MLNARRNPLMSSQEVNAAIRDSLGLPPKPEPVSTVPQEGHICDFPIWSYSKRRSTVTLLKITYEDGSFFELDAPKGMPSPSFPGYLDCILFYGQKDLVAGAKFGRATTTLVESQRVKTPMIVS
jgi:hypothetical protein